MRETHGGSKILNRSCFSVLKTRGVVVLGGETRVQYSSFTHLPRRARPLTSEPVRTRYARTFGRGAKVPKLKIQQGGGILDTSTCILRTS